MQHYLTNPQVIHETIDGETIIIDLATGTYFSLRGSGPDVWNALATGAADDDIVTALAARTGAASDEVVPAVHAFLNELATERLIVASERGVDPTAAAPSPSLDTQTFVAPRLEKYVDMQDIILLDPVHKVDSEGWPEAAPPTELA